MGLEYPYRQLGNRIRDRRKAIGLTQDNLAEKLGISRGSLANIETEKQRILVHQLYHFAQALETDVSELLPKMTGEGTIGNHEGLPIAKGTPAKFLGDIQKLYG